MASPGGLVFSALLLVTLLAIYYAAWRGVTAQRQTLKSTEGWLREAIEGLQHGFELYDADDRLVMCNEEVIKHEPHLEGVLKPGVKFETVIRATAMSGLVPEANGRIDEWVAERMARHRNPKGMIENKTSDGRWYMVSESRTHGGGTVYLRTDITERKQAEEALRETGALLLQAQEIGRIGNYIWDEIEDREIYASDVLKKILGLDPGEALPKMVRLLDRVHPDDHQHFKDMDRKIDDLDEPIEFEYRIIRRDGEVRYLHEHCEPVFNDSGLRIQSVGIVQDITERKRAEAVLRESEARFRNLVESTNVIPWELDVSTWRFTYVGPHAERLTGYPAEDWYAENFWVDHIHASDREFAVALCGEATARCEDHDFEYRMIAADGRIVWLRDIVTVVHGDDGPESLRGFMIDITERKQAEEALRISEGRLAHAHRLAKLGHWWLDVDQDRLRGSPEMAAIFGVEEFFVTCDEFMTFVHPDDRHLEGLKYGAGVDFDNTYDIEYRIIRPDGELRHIHEIGEPYRDAAGNIIGETGSVQDITERKRGEKLLRTVVDSLPQTLNITDADGRYVLINKRQSDYHGLDPRAVIGKHADDIFPPSPNGEKKKRELKQVIETGVAITDSEFQYEVDGRVEYWLTSRQPIADSAGNFQYVLTVSRDITEAKLAENALIASEARLAEAQRISKLGHWEWNLDDDSIFMSTEIAQMIGSGPGGKFISFDEFRKRVHADDRAEFHRNMERFRTSRKPYDIDYRIVREDGETRYLNEKGEYKYNENGRSNKAFGMIHDVTESKLAEMALVAAKDQAELASRAKSEFLANMSHDLRTPLNAIIGFADMMKNEMLGPIGEPKYREYVEAISDSGAHLLSMINDILDLSKIESSSARLHEVEVDIGRVIDDVMTLLALKAKSGEVELVKANSQDLPRINADEDRVRQMLSNLLSNAVKFTLPGGIVKIVAERCGEGGLKITVSDTGIGISEDDIPMVLEPFGQVDNAMTRKFEGTGLGLPLVRAMIRQHDGDFRIDSEVGVGTSVIVTFPAGRII